MATPECGRLRKGDERRLCRAVEQAEARASALRGAEKDARAARQESVASAELASQELHKYFRRVVDHKHELAGLVRQARKDACQPIADAAAVCVALRRALRNAERTDVGAEARLGDLAQHARLVALGGTAGKGRARAQRGVRFSATGDSGAWEVRPGAASRPLAPLNAARTGHAGVVASQGSVFVVGGLGDCGKLGSCERLASQDSAWVTQPTDMPTKRARCGACAVGNLVVVAGGRDALGHDVRAVEALHTDTGAWTRLPALPAPVSGCAMAAWRGRVVVVGGNKSARAWVLDLGGRARGAGEPLVVTGQWEPLPPMSSVRGLPGAAAGEGRVFVCGGFDGAFRLASCEALRLRGPSPRWEPLPAMPTNVSSPGCCYGGGNVFVVGGSAGTVWHPLTQSLHALSLCVPNSGWVAVGALATARQACVAVCVARRVLVLGGRGSSGDNLCDCEQFDV